jgi:hypothetical protein
MAKFIWEEYETDEGERALYVTDDSTVGHTVAEGCIGEIISESQGALESLVDAIERELEVDKVIELATAAHHIIRHEMETKLDILDGFPRKDLRPKHRDCRVILTRASRVFARNSPLVEDREFDHIAFASDAVNLIKALHLCLLEQTTRNMRDSVRRGYLSVAAPL